MATCPITSLALPSDGHSGFTCAQITANAAAWYAALSPKPRMVLLQIGANDLIAVSLSSMTYADAMAAFTTCLNTIVGLDNSMTFFVANQLNYPAFGGGTFVVPFNDNVATQVAVHRNAGRRIYLVDMYTALLPIAEPTAGADFNSGGIHPIAAGYTKMSQRWYDTIIATR